MAKFEDLSGHSHGQSREEIRTEYVRNRNLGHYSYAILFDSTAILLVTLNVGLSEFCMDHMSAGSKGIGKDSEYLKVRLTNKTFRSEVLLNL
jgi:hypothetical protein